MRENTEVLRPRVRSEPLSEAIPTVPLDAIRQFLRGPHLVDAQTLAQAPQVVAFAGQRLIAGAGDEIYASGIDHGTRHDWSVVKRGQVYRDPDDGSVLGIEAIPVGRARLIQPGHGDTAAVLALTRSARETEIGDRLLPPPPLDFGRDFHPHPPARKVRGRIIAVFEGVAEIGQYQIVTLDRGARDGLDPGTVLRILRGGRRVARPGGDGTIRLPARPVGLLMVFNVPLAWPSRW
jgi:hypothetical protein